ncbi:MAG TPA: glycogen synthase [Thermoanaerobaculia bacterium]|jgi:starch synthase|nr:glycogen synthase [Thermoanaerobaculia bacterium]
MPFRICQLAAEVTPFAKTGGLGDVVAGLSGFLARDGHDVRVFLPFYAQIARRSETFIPVDFIRDVPVAIGPRHYTFSLLTTPLPGSDVPVYFVDCPELFAHDGIYHGDWLDWLRFAVLTRAAFESCQRMGWGPDVVHCHDWHTALAPILLKALYGWDRLFDHTRSVLTIHNLAYQGYVPANVVSDLGLGSHVHWLDAADLAAGRFNFMKTGILHADFITAVSRTFAREIQTSEHGFGLDPLLRARGDRLVGIVNGVDYGEWDPETDPHLFYHYSAREPAGKWSCKRNLLRETGLDERTAAPLIGVVSRLTPQKGFDLCFEVLPELLARRDLRLVALGSGEKVYEDFFQGLQERFPGKAWFFKGFNNELAHRIEAGADLFLMPSKFEPCGLNQMYSLKYGTPPLVHKTGGLADTVELFDSATGAGTGFVFDHFVPAGLRWALDYALDTYLHRTPWEKLMANGMAQDFSWDRQGKEYVELYGRMVG